MISLEKTGGCALLFGQMLTRNPQLSFTEVMVRPLLKLKRVEDMIKEHRVFGGDVPSRPTLIEWCESGTWETKRINGIYFVYEDSFLDWIGDMAHADAA